MSGEQNGEQNEQNCWRYIPTYVPKTVCGQIPSTDICHNPADERCKRTGLA